MPATPLVGAARAALAKALTTEDTARARRIGCAPEPLPLRFVLLLLLLALPGAGHATCPPHAFTPDKKVRLQGDTLMIVTHATSAHDARLATKRGIDEALRLARSSHIPVIYLQDDSPGELYFMSDCAPDYWVQSQGGEIGFEVTPGQLYITGGHLEMCMSATLHDVLLNWSRRPQRDYSVTYLMDAIYSNGKGIDESDPYFADFERFMEVVTYGRAGGEHWPKLTLLETLGIIRDEGRQLDYLQRMLPHYERTLSTDYRVELRLNDGPARVLQPGRGKRPPVLRFTFLDSALALTDPASTINPSQSDR